MVDRGFRNGETVCKFRSTGGGDDRGAVCRALCVHALESRSGNAPLESTAHQLRIAEWVVVFAPWVGRCMVYQCSVVLYVYLVDGHYCNWQPAFKKGRSVPLAPSSQLLPLSSLLLFVVGLMAHLISYSQSEGLPELLQCCIRSAKCRLQFCIRSSKCR